MKIARIHFFAFTVALLAFMSNAVPASATSAGKCTYRFAHYSTPDGTFGLDFIKVHQIQLVSDLA